MNGLARRRLSNILSLLGANVLARVLTLAYVMVVARALGLEAFGQLATVTAYVAIFGVLTDIGLTTLTVRDVARDRTQGPHYLIHALVVRGLLAGLAYAALLLVVAGYPTTMQGAFVVGGLALIPSALAGAFTALLTAHERMDLVALLSSLVAVLLLGLAWPVLAAGWGVRGLLGAMVAATVFQAGLAAWWGLRRIGLPRAPFRWPQAWGLLRLAWPYGAFSLLGIVYLRIATVILSGLGGDAVVGIYNAAFKLVEALTVLPIALMGGLFPLMAAQALQGADGPLATTYTRATRLLGVLAFPLGVGTSLLAAPIVRTLYGPAYVPAAPVLAVLIWGLALLFLNAPLGHVIFSSDQTRAFLPWAALNTALYAVLTLGLVAWFGALGAAAAFVVAELSGLLLQRWFVRPILGRIPSLAGLLARPALAAALMGGVIGGLGMFEVRWILLVPLGALVYLGSLLGLGEVRKEDRAQLRAWLVRVGPVPGGPLGV